MKKVLYAAFCLVLVMGVGCVITNYPIITDEEQGNNNGWEDGIVNTNGKAHIIDKTQVASLGDNGWSSQFSFIDQKADGSSTIYNYKEAGNATSTEAFHDDLYCNPDWNGCAVWTADNAGVSFASTINLSCEEGVGWLKVSVGARYGECGKSVFLPKTLPEQISLLNMGQYGDFQGMNGLFYNFGMANTTLLVNNQLVNLGQGELFISPRDRKATLDISDPMFRRTLLELGQIAPKGTVVDFTVMFNGIQAMGAQGSVMVGDFAGMAARNY
jgi:hypothetical protein